MYRYDERTHAAPIIGSARGDRQRQATLVDHLHLLLCCACALLPAGALALSSQGVALLAVIHPLVDALHVPLTVLIFLLHPVILVIDGRQRQRIGSGDRRDREVGAGGEGAGLRREVLLLGVPVPLWHRIKRVCLFGVSYFGTAWCLLLTLTLVGCISWSESISAGSRAALALLGALHLAGLFLVSGILLLGKLWSWWIKASRR